MKHIEDWIYKNMLERLLQKDISKKERYLIHTAFFMFYLFFVLLFVWLPISFIIEFNI